MMINDLDVQMSQQQKLNGEMKHDTKHSYINEEHVRVRHIALLLQAFVYVVFEEKNDQVDPHFPVKPVVSVVMPNLFAKHFRAFLPVAIAVRHRDRAINHP